jgi:hypothetical protein
LNDKDIGRMTPRALKIELEQINEYRLEQSLVEYMRAGGKPEKLPRTGTLYRKYKEMMGVPAEPKTTALDDAEMQEIEKMHEGLKTAQDPKAELEKLVGGLH